MLLLDITGFIGRFHPLMVHLPIGFILAAVLIEWRMKDLKYKSAISYLWLLSGITAAVASLCGWFLANDGSYANWTLFAHRWLGILIAVLSLYAWYLRRADKPSALGKKITNIAAVVMLMVTGHLGGNMTHGSDYLLEYAPSPVQKLMGYGSKGDMLPQYNNPDSVLAYRDIILPTLERKCMSCHNDKVQNGGLNLASIESTKLGGDGGPVVVAGDISSELLRRVTLPTNSSKFMPSSGTHMTYHEIKLLEWWISEGANYDLTVSDIPVDESEKATLMSLYGLDVTPRPWIDKKTVTVPDSSVFASISETGIKINLLAQNNGWVEISLPNGEKVTVEQLESLSVAAEQITWVNLQNCNLDDSHMTLLSSLKNITKLKVQGNDITSEGIRALKDLPQLEVLNLTNTKVDDSIFEIITNFPQLKSLFLWQSAVTEEAVNQAVSSFPDLEIISGINL